MVFYDYTKFTFQIEGLNEVKIIQISNFSKYSLIHGTRNPKQNDQKLIL